MWVPQTDTVRAEWSFDLARVCQRFAGAALDPEPEHLIGAVNELANALPEPASHVERLVLRDRLHIATESAGRQFHGQFHREISSECHNGRVAISRAVRWDDFDCTPHQFLARWVEGFLRAFAQSHAWPPPVQAARLIRHAYDKPFDVRAIARTVGCARSVLIRSFKEAHGISMGEYQTRCRVSSAFTQLRIRDSNVGAVAFSVGYQSTKNFYRALRDVTGMTPTAVRELSDEGATRIANTMLRLPTATFTSLPTHQHRFVARLQ
jgi:AraC-like DNA-binding protein